MKVDSYKDTKGDVNCVLRITTWIRRYGIMKDRLNRLFDFQRVADNSRLASIISDTEERNGIRDGVVRLSDDDLEFVNAASAIDPRNVRDQKAKAEEEERNLKTLLNKLKS